MLDHTHQNHNINLWEAFILIWVQKITHFFLKILQKKVVILLFWVIWASLATHT